MGLIVLSLYELMNIPAYSGLPRLQPTLYRGNIMPPSMVWVLMGARYSKQTEGDVTLWWHRCSYPGVLRIQQSREKSS